MAPEEGYGGCRPCPPAAAGLASEGAPEESGCLPCVSECQMIILLNLTHTVYSNRRQAKFDEIQRYGSSPAWH